MEQVRNLAKYPFLRILAPFMLGICAGNESGSGEKAWIPLSLCFLFAAFSFAFHACRLSYARRHFFGMAAFSAFFFLGQYSAIVSLRSVDYPWSEEAKVYSAVLLDAPEEKERSMLCRVLVTHVYDSLGLRPVNRKVLLYVPKDSAGRKIGLKDDLLFHGRVASPSNNGNPDEFDYAGYLKHKRVSGIAFAGAGHWAAERRESIGTLKQEALLLRGKILEQYRKLGFTGDEYSVLSALTVGYKEDLSEDMQRAYAVAGASHVLALSGLNIGLLGAFLYFVLDLLFRWKGFRVPKSLVVLVCLWAFSFITGLSPSVVRAVVMFSLLLLARMVSMQSITLNTVCLAAFLMLLWEPFYLYDISFQLSYLAVAGIVLVVPWLNRKIVVKNRVLNYLWQLTAVSIAAQLGTLPVILYNFSSLPLYSLLFNVPVVMLAYTILVSAIVMLALFFFTPLQHFAALLTGWQVKALNSIARLVESMPFASLDNLYFHWADVAAFYLLLLLFVLHSLRWVRVRCWMWGGIVCFLCVFHVAERSVPAVKSPLAVFYNSSFPLVHFVHSEQLSYLQMPSDAVGKSRDYLVAGFMRKHRLEDSKLLSGDYADRHLWSRNGITSFEGCTVCVVSDNRWRNKTASLPLEIDYLYISRGYWGTLAELQNLFRVKKVVLNKSLGRYRLNKLQDECRELGLECVSLGEDGALLVNI